MTSIAVLEDDARIANFLVSGLTAESFHVECFSQINDFIETLQLKNFEILIMDRMIGKLDALGWIKSIRMTAPNIKIIILSALSGSLNRIRGLEIGADDYLEKPFQYQELSIRVRNLLKRETTTLETILNYKDITLELEGQKVQRAGKNINLSPYEFKIMTIFLRAPEKVHSRTLLLDKVWGCNRDTSSNVVDVAIAKLRKKINLEGNIPLINSRRGSGYVLYGNHTNA